MHNISVGKIANRHAIHIERAASSGLLAISVLILQGQNAAAGEKYFIPPPPPTPVLAVPPPPTMLPYSEAYANYKAPATRASMVKVAPPTVAEAHSYLAGSKTTQPVRSTPNFTGLSLTTAQSRGYGKPRVAYATPAPGPGAANAAASPHYSAPAMNTWFDSSLRWYANHSSASNYYNALANQTPHFKPEAPLSGMPQPAAFNPVYEDHPTVQPKRPARRHFKRVVAYK